MCQGYVQSDPGLHARLVEQGGRWLSSQPGVLVPVKVLSRLFRGRLLALLAEAHAQDHLRFFGDHAALADKRAFNRFLAPLRSREWVVYTKRPFAGPQQVLCYLSPYTPRAAISHRRLVAADANAIAFRWKDYRASMAASCKRPRNLHTRRRGTLHHSITSSAANESARRNGLLRRDIFRHRKDTLSSWAAAASAVRRCFAPATSAHPDRTESPS